MPPANRHNEAELRDRHWHVWLYERDEDGTINILRRHPDAYEKRGRAVRALQGFQKGYDCVTAGQVLQCDNGAFCQPSPEYVRGITIGGPAVIPVNQFIDRQTPSMRPARKQLLGEGVLQKLSERGEVDYPFTGQD